MNIFKYGIIYRTYDFVRSYFRYRKTHNNIKDVFYGYDFQDAVKRYLNVELDKDWLGRLYGVLNPNIDINGNFDVNNVIIEIDGNNTNTDEYVKTWIYRQLNLMGQLFAMRNFYANVILDIEHVGPENMDNYLIVFDNADRPEMAASFKRWLRTFISYLFIAGTTVGALFAFHVL